MNCAWGENEIKNLMNSGGGKMARYHTSPTFLGHSCIKISSTLDWQSKKSFRKWWLMCAPFYFCKGIWNFVKRWFFAYWWIRSGDSNLQIKIRSLLDEWWYTNIETSSNIVKSILPGKRVKRIPEFLYSFYFLYETDAVLFNEIAAKWKAKRQRLYCYFL